MNKTLLNGDFFESDNFCKLSEKAQLYYIRLLLHANNGFVSNPKGILDSMGYDKSILLELKNNGDILVKHNRDEIFITCYFLHNEKLNRTTWRTSPFALYWKDLWIKSNGVATVKAKENADDNEDTILKDMGIMN